MSGTTEFVIMLKFSLSILAMASLIYPLSGYCNAQGGSPPTGDGVPSPAPVNLGTAGKYVILAKTELTTVPNSSIFGDIGVSPAAASFITGFSLTADASNVFSTSTQVTGRVYAANYAAPTPANLTTAIADMGAAYIDAASRTPNVTDLGSGNISGMTLTRGVYKWNTDVVITQDITLSGTASDVWVFQVAQNLSLSDATNIRLLNGALPSNIYWQVGGKLNLGMKSHFEGVVLAKLAIRIQNGATVDGGLFGQTAVHLDNSAIAKTYTTGVSAYGTGTPGCHGTLGMNASAIPRVNTPTFAFLCSMAPVNSFGVGIVTDSQDLVGTFLQDWGVLLHLDATTATEVETFNFASGQNRLGVGPIPIPNDPKFIGETFFAQSLWIQSFGDACSGSPLNLVSSNGVSITVQP